MIEKAKKPIYKKWWFIALIVIFVAGAFGNIFESDETKQERIAEEDAAEQAAEERAKERELAAEERRKLKEEQKAEKELAAKKKEEEKALEKAKAEEVIAITATDLYKAYQDNEVAADLKYKGKQLEVTGTISDFGVDVFGTAFIMLATGGPFKDTQVFFRKGQEEKIAELSKGEEITIIGKGGGLIITSLAINKAELK